MVIDTLELNIVVDNKGTTARINNTTNALKNLHKVISDINGAGGVNGAVNGGGGGGSSSRGGSSRSSGSKSASSLMKNLNFGALIGKLYFVKNITKQLGQELAKVVQYGIDYEETLNLWQVAMNGNISQAKVFVSEMNKAYGISSATLMNYQATFKNMLSALGNLNEEVSYGLSEALTGMALDYASLYNTSIESAMTKFQAVLAGQVRPIRSESGYDITESTIFALYQELGGTKTVRQLDQTEKRLLRILAVYKQMQGVATGDLAKTITSSANQLRVMKEQGQEFATWIGVAFNTMLEKSEILVEINAYLYALSALAEKFAISLGYVEKDYSIKEPIEEANTALDGATDKVDELKGKLLGFDKFQVLSSAQADTQSLDIAQEITKAIQEYESIINNAENPAFERSLKLLEEMGVQLDENGNIISELFDTTDLTTLIQSVFESVKTWMGALGMSLPSILNILGVLAETVMKAEPMLAELITLLLPIVTEFFEPLTEGGYSLTIIFGDIIHLAKTFLTAISPVLSVFFQILHLLTPILETVRPIVWLISTALSWALINIVLPILTMVSAVFEFILKCVRSIVEVLRTLFNWDWSSIAKNFTNIWSVWATEGAANLLDQVKNSGFQYSPQWKADGGLATKGSLFYAGEAGPELVTQTSGGNSTIMNMRQLEDAVAKGMFRAMVGTRTEEGEQVINVGVDGQNLFTIFRGVARRNGYDLVKVN